MTKTGKFLTLLSLIIFFNSAQTAFASSILISQVMVAPSLGPDWVKLINASGQTIDLTNWTLSDSASIMKTLSGPIDPGQTLEEDVSNRLNNSGDEVTLKDATGNIIDSYSYTSNPGVDVILTPGEIPTPTPSPSISPNPTPSPSSSPTSNFQISSDANTLNSDSSLTVSINLNLPAKPNTSFFLKGAFYKDTAANYFGLTRVNGSWVKNSSGFSSQLPIQTDSSGNYQGQINLMADPTDSGFTGSGSYLLKVARYTQSGDLTWSNNLSISINYNNPPSPTPITKASPSSSPKTSPSSKPAIVSGQNDPPSNQTTDVAGVSITNLPTLGSGPSLTALSPINQTIEHSSPKNLILGIILIVLGLGTPAVLFFRNRLPLNFLPLRLLFKKS